MTQIHVLAQMAHFTHYESTFLDIVIQRSLLSGRGTSIVIVVVDIVCSISINDFLNVSGITRIVFRAKLNKDG